MMDQGAFNFEAAPDPPRERNRPHLDRVGSRIGKAVMEFCRTHPTFHAQELRDYVAAETGIIAPASADRVLRDLRQKGLIDYKIVNRRASLYEVLRVAETDGDDETD